MTAKEYLSQIEAQSVIIDNLDKEIERLLKDATAVSSPDYSAQRSNCSRTSGITEQYKMVESAVDLIRKLFKSRELANKIRFRIIGEIHQLDNANYIKLLYKRYVEFKNFRLIAKEMNYEEDHMRHLHGQALKEFEKVHTKSHNNVCYNDTVKN